jgi:sarcosine oxidase, subunit gamma
MAELRRLAPLEHRSADLARIAERTGGAVVIEETAFLAQLDVRTDDPASMGLPETPNTWRGNALWLGPDEWLMVQEEPAQEAASVVDVSANRAVLELRGDGVTELLEKGCSLDLDPSRWAEGDCAQTMLAKAPVILQHRGEAIRVFVRPSFADYLVEWLLAATG